MTFFGQRYKMLNRKHHHPGSQLTVFHVSSLNLKGKRMFILVKVAEMLFAMFTVASLQQNHSVNVEWVCVCIGGGTGSKRRYQIMAWPKVTERQRVCWWECGLDTESSSLDLYCWLSMEEQLLVEKHSSFGTGHQLRSFISSPVNLTCKLSLTPCHLG